MEIVTGFLILILLAILSLIVADIVIDIQNQKKATPPTVEDLEP